MTEAFPDDFFIAEVYKFLSHVFANFENDKKSMYAYASDEGYPWSNA